MVATAQAGVLASRRTLSPSGYSCATAPDFTRTLLMRRVAPASPFLPVPSGKRAPGPASYTFVRKSYSRAHGMSNPDRPTGRAIAFVISLATTILAYVYLVRHGDSWPWQRSQPQTQHAHQPCVQDTMDCCAIGGPAEGVAMTVIALAHPAARDRKLSTTPSRPAIASHRRGRRSSLGSCRSPCRLHARRCS